MKFKLNFYHLLTKLKRIKTLSWFIPKAIFQSEASSWANSIFPWRDGGSAFFRGLPLRVRHAWLLSANQPVGDGVSERRVKPARQSLSDGGYYFVNSEGEQERDRGEKSLTVIPASNFWRLFFFPFCLIEAFYLGILVYVYKKTRILTLDYKGPCSHSMTITLRFNLGEFRLSLLLMFIVVCFMGVYNRIVAGAGSSCAKPYTKTAKLQTGRAHRQFPSILECGSVFGAMFWLVLVIRWY